MSAVYADNRGKREKEKEEETMAAFIWTQALVRVACSDISRQALSLTVHKILALIDVLMCKGSQLADIEVHLTELDFKLKLTLIETLVHELDEREQGHFGCCTTCANALLPVPRNNNNDNNNHPNTNNNTNDNDKNNPKKPNPSPSLVLILHHLQETIDQIHRELETIHAMTEAHKRRWFSTWTSVNYDKNLAKLEKLKQELDRRFEWLIRVGQCLRRYDR